MDIRVCASNPAQPDFTLCGDAFDAFDTGDAEEQHVEAKKGQTVTCQQCCLVIDNVISMRYRLKPRKE